MSEPLDVVVLGAGVVGLACARAFAQQGREVFVVEAEAGIGRGTSSRNSGVIHAGLYYPRSSWKGRLCTAGAAQLYAFCREHGVGHERTGKWIRKMAKAAQAAFRSIGSVVAHSSWIRKPPRSIALGANAGADRPPCTAQ